MSLTRKMLSAMGIEPEKIDQIIESHTETVEGLKKQADDLREQAEKVPELEKKIEELSNVPNDGEEWKAKYDEEHEEFEKFKADVAADKAKTEKVNLFRALLREAGVDDKYADTVVKVTDFDKMEVSDGALKDHDDAIAKVKEEWADFIVREKVEGAKVDTPPNTSKNTFESLTLAEKMQFANDNPGDPAVKAWLGN